MDAQHMEAKLLEEANAAWEAYYAEKDPARSDKLEKRWNKAQDALERFRGQQVAGGGSEDRVAQLGSEVARLGYELQQVKIASNRAANSSQREAYIGKVRRAQVKTSSFPDELPNVPAASMRAVVKTAGLLGPAPC